MSNMTYEESVRWMRSQPSLTEMVKSCYLDQNTYEAAKRFSSSEEFLEVVNILALQRSRHSLRILDLGCGNGIASYAFASQGHNVFAVDPDESTEVGIGAIPQISSKLNDGSITTCKAFAEDLPFASSSFDVVYARQALHHFADLSVGIAQCARVLKQGGLFLATREHVVSNNLELDSFLRNHILHKLHGGENAYTVDTYISSIEGAGLKILRCFGPFDSVINHFPASNAEVREKTLHYLHRRVGKTIASVLMRRTSVELLYRSYLSKTCTYPGRMYSFLCVKPE